MDEVFVIYNVNALGLVRVIRPLRKFVKKKSRHLIPIMSLRQKGAGQRSVQTKHRNMVIVLEMHQSSLKRR
jgi:hypothetical protein